MLECFKWQYVQIKGKSAMKYKYFGPKRQTQERKTFVDIVTKDKSTLPKTLKTDFAARNVLTIHLLYILDDVKVTLVHTLLCCAFLRKMLHLDTKSKIKIDNICRHKVYFQY